MESHGRSDSTWTSVFWRIGAVSLAYCGCLWVIFGRQLLAKLLLKTRPSENRTPRNRDCWSSYNSLQDLAQWNLTALLCMGVRSVREVTLWLSKSTTKP